MGIYIGSQNLKPNAVTTEKIVDGTITESDLDAALQAKVNAVAAPLDGTGTSGTWPINVTGNAATATTAAGLSASGGDGTFSWDAGNNRWSASGGLELEGSLIGNVTGNADTATTLTGVLAANLGGAGTTNGIMKANGSGVVSAATSGTDYAPGTAALATGILKSANGTGALSAASGADVAGLLTSVKNDLGIGGYKLASGLTNWRQSLGMAGKSFGGTGLGGVDVCVIGDSIAEGANGTTYLCDTWVHRLKLRLQSAYNPSGVVGGYGFIPVAAGTTPTLSPSWAGCPANTVSLLGNVWTFESGWSVASSNSFIGNKGASITSSVKRAYFVLDGTDTNISKRLASDSVELIGARATAGNMAVWTWDAFAGGTTYGTAGTGSPTGIVAVGALDWGHRWGNIALTSTNKNLIQVTSGASSTTYLDGLIAYNGDYACGVRVHNLSRYGTFARTHTNASIAANDAKFGSAAGINNGAVQCKLLISDFITNESANDSVTGANLATKVAAFITDYGLLIDNALAWTSKPSVLLIIPPRLGLTDTTFTGTIYPAFVDAVYSLADARANVAVLNLNVALGYNIYGGGQAVGPYEASGRGIVLGWSAVPDVTHNTDTGGAAFADYVFRAVG